MRFLIAFLAPALLCLGQAPPRVVAVTVGSVIHPITTEILAHAAQQAGREQAQFLLVRLNTPGGLLEATRATIEKMVASPVPVVTFVSPAGGRAASAGFFLLQAGDVAAMAEGTHTGAASPVILGQPMDPTMRKKVESDTTALLRSLASKRGRNSELAEKTVLEAKSFTAQEAFASKLVDLLAADETRLLAALDGREVTRFDGRKTVIRSAGAQVIEYELTLRERVTAALSDPNLAFVMMALGALGLYIEFTSPGLVFPGVAGGILLILGLMALSVLPINWAAAALLALAAALFVLEAKVASHGILGAGGAVAMVMGALLLVEGPPEMRIRLATALAVSLPFAIITVFLVSLVVKARARPAETGKQGLLLQTGVALTALAPAGTVFIEGEFWNAVSSVPLPEGARVRVTAVEGLVLKVEPAP
jgi:membrane-bound serine protease (ClpP class)